MASRKPERFEMEYLELCRSINLCKSLAGTMRKRATSDFTFSYKHATSE